MGRWPKWVDGLRASLAWRRTSMEERGVFWEVIELMRQSEQRGLLISQDRPLAMDDVAGLVGGDRTRTLSCLDSLLGVGLLTRTAAGAICFGPMVAESRKSQRCSEAGRRGGGNPTFKGRSKGGGKGRPKGDVRVDVCGDPPGFPPSHSPLPGPPGKTSPQSPPLGGGELLKNGNGKGHSEAELRLEASAVEVVRYLNLKAKTTFDPFHESTLRMVRERVKESSIEECKLVVDHKVAAWRKDPKLREFLRPKTLFGKANFENYRGGIRMLKINGRPLMPEDVKRKLRVWDLNGREGHVCGLRTDEGLVEVFWHQDARGPGSEHFGQARPEQLFLEPPTQLKLEGVG